MMTNSSSGSTELLNNLTVTSPASPVNSTESSSWHASVTSTIQSEQTETFYGINRGLEGETTHIILANFINIGYCLDYDLWIVRIGWILFRL